MHYLGINLCFANLLLSRGCNVLFADLALRKEAQDSVAKHTIPKSSTLGRAAFQRTDVSVWKQLERMFDVAQDHFGGAGVDIVVPGAGVYEPVSSHSCLMDGGVLTKTSHGQISGILQGVLSQKTHQIVAVIS